MTLIKPFGDLTKEFTPKENLEYIGRVEDNEDPKLLGRVRVRISIWEDLETSEIPWARPMLPSFLGLSSSTIMFSVPKVGSQVKIYFPEKGKYEPAYKNVELTNDNVCPFFQTSDYPNYWGWYDNGNFFAVNNNKNTMQLQHSSGTNVLFNADGSFAITQTNGTYISTGSDGSFTISQPNGTSTHCDAGGGMTYNCTGDVTFNCTNFVVNASQNATINSPSTHATGILSDHKDSLDVVRSEYNDHIHPAGDGFTGGTTVPM